MRTAWACLRRCRFTGPDPRRPPTEPLDLQPGELVQVRSPAEIKATLDDQGFNRGLSFDREMLPYCGRTLRVKARVNRLIDEKTGRMLRIPKDCIILEGSVCSGECSTGRWFCPREIYPYWREAWLRRVEDPAPSAGARWRSRRSANAGSMDGVGETHTVGPHDLAEPRSAAGRACNDAVGRRSGPPDRASA